MNHPLATRSLRAISLLPGSFCAGWPALRSLCPTSVRTAWWPLLPLLALLLATGPAPVASAAAPSVTAPASFALTEDAGANLTYTGMPFADADSATLTVTFSVSDGTTPGNAGTGMTVGGTATAQTFTGTIAGLNTNFTAKRYPS